MATAQLTAVVDTKGVTKAKNDLNSISKSAKVVDINTKKASKSFKTFGTSAAKAVSAIDGPLGGIASRITALTSLASSGAVAVGALASAVTALGFAAVIGIRELDKYNVSLKRVEATIKATGEGVGFTGEQLQKTAEQLAIATLASVDGVQRAQAKLLTFNRVLGDEFTKSIELAQDLAEAGFGSIESNAVLLGKALQDPIKGISALTRVGVTLTEQQKDLAKQAAEVGDVFEAQRIVLSAVASQVEGVGQAVANGTLAGELDSTGIAVERLTRAFAESSGVFEVWRRVVRGAGVAANELAESLEGPTADDLFSASLESSLKLAEARAKLATIESTNSNAYNRQAAIVSRLNKENQEAIRLASEAAEIENKKIQAQGEAARKEIEARKRIKEELQAEANAKKELQAQEDAEKLAKQQEAARKQLAAFEALNDSELEAIRRKEEARLAILKEFRDEELITKQQFEDSKTDIEDAANAEREKLEKDLSDKKKDQDKNRVRSQEEAGRDVVSNLRTSLGEQSALYKAAAITQATIDTYAAANAAFKALAGIPVVGPALGAAAAGVVVGAGIANVQRISSAREQGGQISAGESVLVGERGPEVITAGSSGRVRTANQIKNDMGSGSTQVSLVVIDQSSGNKEFTQEEQDDGRIVLLIRNTVAADTANPNSDISKSISNFTTAERRR